MTTLETFYKNHYFKNKLTARWAIFFDEAEIPYQTDIETIEWNENESCIPDFYLPWFNAYVVIKPKDCEDIDTIKHILCELFNSCDAAVILCIGEPIEHDMRIFCNDLTDSNCGGVNEWKAMFLEGIAGETNGVRWSKGEHYISLVIGSENDRFREFFNRKWELLPSSIHIKEVKSYRLNFEYAQRMAHEAKFKRVEMFYNSKEVE